MTRAEKRALIERYSMPVTECGCWIWLRGYGSHHYGALRLPGARSMTTAPRVAFEAWHGKLKPREMPRHTCGQRWCCNPGHLRRGKNVDNMRDKFRDRTSAWWSRTGRGPLSIDDIYAISSQYAEVGNSHAVGREFGVTHMTVLNIVKLVWWSHLAVG